MTQQWTFTRFDLGSLARQPRQYLVGFLFVVAVAAVGPLPALALPAAALMISVMAGTTFALDERGRLDTLYATLPTSRRSVVLGRYLTTLSLWGALTVVGALAAVLAPVLRGRTVTPELLVPMLVGGFGIAALVISIQLPFFFAVGYTRARPVLYAPAVVIAGATFLAGRLGVSSDDFATPGPALALGAGTVALGMVLLAVSARISTRLYTRRQL